MFRIVVHRRAARYLARLPADERTRLKSRLAQLREQPKQGDDVRAMRGDWAGYWRLRIGSLRVIFWIDDGARTVFVDHIGPRGDVYK
jgi:mRNA interferase RelE/StbE